MKKYLGILIFSLVFVKLSAADIIVSSIIKLQSAIANAKPGDRILVANGVYNATNDIIINKIGTEKKPITIAAQHLGAAEITGKGGIKLTGPAAYIIIRGFKFTHASGRARSEAGSSFCRWSQNIFETPGKGEDLTIAGNDQEVDYNTFINKNAFGRMLAVRGKGSQIAERLSIHHNYFKNYPSQGGDNGAETFQFGLSGFSLSSSNSTVEYNLFEDCAGENELISVKASAVILRYNTIRNCAAQFTLRHGNKCEVYGNYFINTPGLRIFGDDHVIHSNYFENCNPAINIGNGGAEVADGAPLISHDRPDRVFIGFNTLVGNQANITQSARKDGLGSTAITVAYNIIQGGGVAANIVGPSKDSVWKGNIIFNTAGAGNMPQGAFNTVDPGLLKNASGTYHLKTNSPAINSVEETLSTVKFDMDGQPRTGKLDKGADEFSNAAVKTKILQSGDVGPAGKK